MDKIVDKFPYKKVLYLQWYQAAIGNLILFKCSRHITIDLKQKFNNNIYFLISDQGILLKATTSILLKNTEEEVNKYFTAKIEQLEISASSDFYQNILGDIKEQTERLKDTRDCPYINLVYSQKLKNSCLSMKKFGYSKPYENWQINQRERRGFCYLIVRPQHRWKQIANNVMALVKKRQGNSYKPEIERSWPVEMEYQKFIWLYLRKQFASLKKNIEVNQKKGESTIIVTFKKDQTEFLDLQKIINILEFNYTEDKPYLSDSSQRNDKKLTNRTIVLTTLQLQKITQLIYHEYGLPNLVRQIRGKNQKYLTIVTTQQFNLSNFMEEGSIASSQQADYRSNLNLREDIGRIKDQQNIANILRLGNRHDLANYKGMNYVMVKYELPLQSNIENMLKLRLPSLPRYFYCYQSARQIYLLRRFEPTKLKAALQNQNINNQIFLINSLVLIIQQLHKREIFVGANFIDNIYVDGQRIIIEPAQIGSKNQDISKLILLVREWVKNMKECDIKNQLQKHSNPATMLPLFDNYLAQNYL